MQTTAKTIDDGHALRQNASSGAAAGPATRKSPIRSTNAALLTDEQAARDVLGVSPRTFAEVMKEPWMCKPVQLGPRLRRWVRTELEAALVNAPRQVEQGSEPAHLRRAKIESFKARGVPA